MKKLLIAALLIFIGQSVMAHVPKCMIGVTFYNTKAWNLDPRFGGIPTIQFSSATKAMIKRGDIMDVATVKTYKTGFIVTSVNMKMSDTFTFVNKTPNAKTCSCELTDQKGNVWSPKFSERTENKLINSFPEPKAGFKRNVIVLPELKNEQEYKIEIYAGVFREVDCNNYTLVADIQEKHLEGYGHLYYEVLTEERIFGTTRDCLDGKKQNKYIYAITKMAQYNSKMPIIIYAPKDMQIRYKVYSVKDEWNYAIPQ